MSVLHPIRSPRGFTIIPVHYSHDPAKSSNPEWLEAEQKKYSRPDEWDKEMEIDFRSRAGKPAYPAFRRSLHLRKGLTETYIPMLPLCLQVDFNVDPMVWEVGQIVKGRPKVFNEIRLPGPEGGSATIEAMVREFRNLYPSHRARVSVYGDATGHARTSQTGQSDYALMKLAFRGYSGELEWKVPAANPLVKDRLNAVNRMLSGVDGLPGIEIDEDNCPELVRDLEEVVLIEKKAAGGAPSIDILKVYDPSDPYHERTHASDCVGYLISREWPVAIEAVRATSAKARPPLKFGRLLGDV
jgi:hypothetical protein